jgi:DNA repair protein RecO (recombination protein O)
LRSMKYRDTSKIVTFYTKKFGKIRTLAKGSRSPKNKYGASLEPMTHSSIILYKKANRDLHLLSKSEIFTPMYSIYAEADRIAIGLAVVELVDIVIRDEEGSSAIFELISHTLHEIERVHKNVLTVFLAFELRFIGLMGYALSLERCVGCSAAILEGNDSMQVHISTARGSVLCSNCRQSSPPGGITMSKGGLKTLLYLTHAPMESVPSLELSIHLQDEILSFLQSYLLYHVQGMRTLRSLTLFSKV